MSLILTVKQTRDRLKKRVCPLFTKGGPRDGLKSPPQVGSAVLLRYDNRSILLTANHVRFDDAGRERDLLIQTPGETDDSTTFVNLKRASRPWTIRLPEYANADVICIPLPVKLADAVGKLCDFVEPSEIGSPDDEVSGCESRFLLIGFPVSKNEPANKNPQTDRARKAWGNTVFFIETESRLPDEYLARDGQSLAAHFALQGDTKMRPFSGGPVQQTPDFHGVSGGGVWKLHVDPRTRLVERCSLVGIFIKREPLRGKIVLTFVRSAWANNPGAWWRDDVEQTARVTSAKGET